MSIPSLTTEVAMLPENFRYIELSPYIRHNGTHVRNFQVQEWCEKAQEFYPVLTLGNWKFQCVSKDETPVGEIRVPAKLVSALRGRPNAVLIFHEKYGRRYFPANTTEEIGRAAVKIVLSRDEQGYFDFAEEPRKPARTPEEFSDEPELAKTVRSQWERYEQDLQEFESGRHEFKLLKKVVDHNNYLAAFRLLELRGRGEYESFEIEELEEA